MVMEWGVLMTAGWHKILYYSEMVFFDACSLAGQLSSPHYVRIAKTMEIYCVPKRVSSIFIGLSGKFMTFRNSSCNEVLDNYFHLFSNNGIRCECNTTEKSNSKVLTRIKENTYLCTCFNAILSIQTHVRFICMLICISMKIIKFKNPQP